jgi:hypothetical protein
VNSRQQNGTTIENAAFEDISNRAIAQARHIPFRANQALDALLGSIRKAAKNGRAGRVGAETKKGSDPWSTPPLGAETRDVSRLWASCGVALTIGVLVHAFAGLCLADVVTSSGTSETTNDRTLHFIITA